MKRLIAVIISLTLILGCFNLYASYGAGRDVRIGLERHYIGVSSIPIDNNVITVQIGEGAKYSVGTGSESGFTAQAAYGSYYNSGLKFNGYNEARLYANEFGDEVIPVLRDNGWGVYFAKTNTETESEAAEEEAFNEDIDITETTTEEEYTEDNSDYESEGFSAVGLGANSVIFNSGESTLFIADGSESVHISTGGGIVDLGDYSYRNIIEIYRNGGTVNAVNILPIEQYLLGVVTSEMPQSWPIEALKAQAVAARTYTQRNLGKHGKYDLCDNTDCQQYNGVNGESASGTQAVTSTKGVMAYYNGQLISATYFSSSGGHTQNAEDVWGTAVPYLVGVPEINETGGKQWIRTFTFTEMTELCNKAGLDVGNVTAVKMGDALEGGLVKTIVIEGTQDSVTLEREEIRDLFKYSTEGSLYSRNFKLSNTAVASNNVYVLAQDNGESVDLSVISAVAAGGVTGPVENVNTVIIGSEGEYVISSQESNMTESQDSVTITGSGYGHGVGMSQYGAKGMAELGYSYTEILKYYYTGIDVR